GRYERRIRRWYVATIPELARNSRRNDESCENSWLQRRQGNVEGPYQVLCWIAWSIARLHDARRTVQEVLWCKYA
ncbi:hypothetical protein, partial [Acinetobacter baumannii]|uniref:hypothetical protein n=1 Tax=Acinetobacter baumannii TaxID=470 RepID=UPI001D16FBB0